MAATVSVASPPPPPPIDEEEWEEYILALPGRGSKVNMVAYHECMAIDAQKMTKSARQLLEAASTSMQGGTRVQTERNKVVETKEEETKPTVLEYKGDPEIGPGIAKWYSGQWKYPKPPSDDSYFYTPPVSLATFNFWRYAFAHAAVLWDSQGYLDSTVIGPLQYKKLMVTFMRSDRYTECKFLSTLSMKMKHIDKLYSLLTAETSMNWYQFAVSFTYILNPFAQEGNPLHMHIDEVYRFWKLLPNKSMLHPFEPPRYAIDRVSGKAIGTTLLRLAEPYIYEIDDKEACKVKPNSQLLLELMYVIVTKDGPVCVRAHIHGPRGVYDLKANTSDPVGTLMKYVTRQIKDSTSFEGRMMREDNHYGHVKLADAYIFNGRGNIQQSSTAQYKLLPDGKSEEEPVIEYKWLRGRSECAVCGIKKEPRILCSGCEAIGYCSEACLMRYQEAHIFWCRRKFDDQEIMDDRLIGWWQRCVNIITGCKPEIYRECVNKGYPLKFRSATTGKVVTFCDYLSQEMLRYSVFTRSVEEIDMFYPLIALIGSTHNVAEMWKPFGKELGVSTLWVFELQCLFCPVRGPVEVPDESKRRVFVAIINLMICMEWFHWKPRSIMDVCHLWVSGNNMQWLYNLARDTIRGTRKKAISNSLPASITSEQHIVAHVLQYDLVTSELCMPCSEPINPLIRYDPW
jgi:hypothetical protein